MRKIGPRPILFVLAWLCAGLLCMASPPLHAYPMPPEFYKLSEELVSWHIPWAKPYAGGKIKALVIAPRGAQRETVELAERLDMDYTYVLTLTPAELGWTSKSGSYAPADGISNDEVIEDLREKLKKDYDVIIVGHIRWSMFPQDLLYEIMKKIHDGTGLVYTFSSFGRIDLVNEMLAKGPGADSEKFVITGVPFAALPLFNEMGPAKVVGLRRFKQGRIVTLDYGTRRPRFQYLTPFIPDDDESYTDLHYEYYMSLVVKSVLWAAKREPAVFFRSWGKDGARFPRKELDNVTFTADLSGKPAPGRIEAEMTIRREDGKVALSRRQHFVMTGPKHELSFELATLPAGRFFADLILRRGDRSVNWATTFFDVESAVRIEEVRTDREWYEPGDKVKITIALSSPLPKGVALVVTMEDTLGRVVARTVPKPAGDGKSASCEFTIEHPLTIIAEIRAALMEGDQLVAEKSKEFSVVRRKWDDFLFCVWSAGSQFNERVRRLMFDRLREAGVDTFTNSGRDALHARRTAEQGFWSIPYMTRYFYQGKDLIRKPCLTDPKFLEKHLAGLEEVARDQMPFDPQGYTLGDECFLTRSGADVCFSPTCIADLRQWLRGEYPSVQALNASWGTNYKSFDEAEPIVLQDARKNGQIPRWVDHRRHMEFVYARMMQRARDAIRKADPTARVGFDGPFNTDSYSGNDWWRLMQVFNLCNIYFHQPDEWEHVRSFARPGTLLGLWYGGYTGQQNENFSRFFPWRALLNGYNSVWWYAVYHGLAACPMDAVTPSMTHYPYFAASAEEIREIKAGIGKALMNAVRQDDAIAVHYSQSSLHASTAYPGIGVLYSVQRQWYTLLEDMGLQYTARAYAQIEKDGIDNSRFRVLILPYSQALSPVEAKKVEEFVRAGGTVIADLRPGIANQHGKLQSPGLLDAVFGVKRTGGKIDLKINAEGKLTAAVGEAPAGTALHRITIDPNIALAGARAMGDAGGTPIIIVNKLGKGRAVLLNFSVTSYGPTRNDERAEQYWKLFRGLLAMAGVRPRVQVKTAKGPMHKCEAVFYRDGDVEYLGFLKYRCAQDEPPQDAEVILDRPAHTYDVRAGEYLGNADRFHATFEIERGKFYARLPYAVESVAVKPEKSSLRAGEPLSVSLSLTASRKKTGRHWFHVQVLGPDGKERRHYAANAAVVNGSGRALIPFALNDPSGKWSVTVRDVASGLTARAEVELQPAQP